MAIFGKLLGKIGLLFNLTYGHTGCGTVGRVVTVRIQTLAVLYYLIVLKRQKVSLVRPRMKYPSTDT